MATSLLRTPPAAPQPEPPPAAPGEDRLQALAEERDKNRAYAVGVIAKQLDLSPADAAELAPRVNLDRLAVAGRGGDLDQIRALLADVRQPIAAEAATDIPIEQPADVPAAEAPAHPPGLREP